MSEYKQVLLAYLEGPMLGFGKLQYATICGSMCINNFFEIEQLMIGDCTTQTILVNDLCILQLLLSKQTVSLLMLASFAYFTRESVWMVEVFNHKNDNKHTNVIPVTLLSKIWERASAHLAMPMSGKRRKLYWRCFLPVPGQCDTEGFSSHAN